MFNNHSDAIYYIKSLLGLILVLYILVYPHRHANYNNTNSQHWGCSNWVLVISPSSFGGRALTV